MASSHRRSCDSDEHPTSVGFGTQTPGCGPGKLGGAGEPSQCRSFLSSSSPTEICFQTWSSCPTQIGGSPRSVGQEEAHADVVDADGAVDGDDDGDHEA